MLLVSHRTLIEDCHLFQLLFEHGYLGGCVRCLFRRERAFVLHGFSGDRPGLNSFSGKTYRQFTDSPFTGYLVDGDLLSVSEERGTPEYINQMCQDNK